MLPVVAVSGSTGATAFRTAVAGVLPLFFAYTLPGREHLQRRSLRGKASLKRFLSLRIPARAFGLRLQPTKEPEHAASLNAGAGAPYRHFIGPKRHDVRVHMPLRLSEGREQKVFGSFVAVLVVLSKNPDHIAQRLVVASEVPTRQSDRAAVASAHAPG